MAEIAYAIASGSSQYVAGRPGPQIYLLNTNGFTNFKWAIDEVIRLGVDIVLYAQVWEYGGNVDGEGFINAEVQRALDRGITWINAAGNFGLSTFHSPVKVRPDLNVTLPHEQQTIRLHVAQNFTPVKIVLAWNDFADTSEHHTRQDLDLILEDAYGREIDASRLLQEGRAPAGDRRYSSHAREIIRTTLDQGEYRLRVRAKSDNFDAASRLRITADGFGVTLLDRTTEQTILMPADHRGVLAIGASDSANSGEGFGRHKPELLVPSAVVFADGTRITGTSAASAIAAGAIAVHMGATGLRGRSNLLHSDYVKPFRRIPAITSGETQTDR